jgi:hypothetical protein
MFIVEKTLQPNFKRQNDGSTIITYGTEEMSSNSRMSRVNEASTSSVEEIISERRKTSFKFSLGLYMNYY